MRLQVSCLLDVRKMPATWHTCNSQQSLYFCSMLQVTIKMLYTIYTANEAIAIQQN